MKTKIAGYMVVEDSRDFCVPLDLSRPGNAPEAGILERCDPLRPHMFPTRREAREAIKRTTHYVALWNYSKDFYPRAELCKIVPVMVKA